MEEEQVKVFLWCIPRSTSTVFAKCLSAIDGLEVYLELFSFATAFRGIYQTTTGRELPINLDGNEAVYDEANELWAARSRTKLIPRRVSCQKVKEDLQNANNKYVFSKEMVYAADTIVPDYLPRGFKHTFLIREPSRVYASFRKAMISMSMSGRPDGDYDMLSPDRPGIQPLLWFEKQFELWKYVTENLDPNPVIIDAFDLVSQPEKTLRAYCKAVGYPYSDGLLRWEPSLECPQNFITAGPGVFKQLFMFYGRASKTTCFVAPSETGPIPRDQLTDDVIRCIDHSMPFYHKMYAKRLCAPTN